jgi:hypothetical protein
VSETRVTFVIGTRNRPTHLAGLLMALHVQKDQRWDAIIVVESDDLDELSGSRVPAAGLSATAPQGQVGYTMYQPSKHDWHQSVKNEVAAKAKGEFLCFPNDDSYYVPTFVGTMLQAADFHGWDLVYCDFLYDLFGYVPHAVAPAVGHIDVGGFLVKKRTWQRHPWTQRGQTGDGEWIAQLVAAGVPHGKAPGVLYVRS